MCTAAGYRTVSATILRTADQAAHLTLSLMSAVSQQSQKAKGERAAQASNVLVMFTNTQRLTRMTSVRIDNVLYITAFLRSIHQATFTGEYCGLRPYTGLHYGPLAAA